MRLRNSLSFEVHSASTSAASTSSPASCFAFASVKVACASASLPRGRLLDRAFTSLAGGQLAEVITVRGHARLKRYRPLAFAGTINSRFTKTESASRETPKRPQNSPLVRVSSMPISLNNCFPLGRSFSAHGRICCPRSNHLHSPQVSAVSPMSRGRAEKLKGTGNTSPFFTQFSVTASPNPASGGPQPTWTYAIAPPATVPPVPAMTTGPVTATTGPVTPTTAPVTATTGPVHAMTVPVTAVTTMTAVSVPGERC
jgi:hypothetical protein